MIRFVSRNRLRLGWALMAMAALSLVAAIVVVANYAAVPNERFVAFACLCSTFFFMAASIFVTLSNFLQNVKR